MLAQVQSFFSLADAAQELGIDFACHSGARFFEKDNCGLDI